MSRMQSNALSDLIDNAEAGGYTLPAELTDAWRTYNRLKATTVDLPAHGDLDAAAARLVSAAAAGEDIDAVTQAAIVEDQHAARARHDQAQTLIRQAQEQAVETTALLCSDLVERIIVEHLAPAHERILAEAADLAGVLKGHALDAHSLLSAPAKVRNAYLRLPELVARRAAIHSARYKLNRIGERTAQHDSGDLFATFAKPMTFHPNWKPPARIPALPIPEDPTTALLWLVGPEAQAAQPWLPTIAQQDAAWWEQFGEGQRMRAQAHANGLAVGARG